MKFCLKCENTFGDSFETCPDCGSTDVSKAVFCRSCGYVNAADAVNCGSCGAVLLRKKAVEEALASILEEDEIADVDAQADIDAQTGSKTEESEENAIDIPADNNGGEDSQNGMLEPIYCRLCGRKNEGDALFCCGCGKKLSKSFAAQDSYDTEISAVDPAYSNIPFRSPLDVLSWGSADSGETVSQVSNTKTVKPESNNKKGSSKIKAAIAVLIISVVVLATAILEGFGYGIQECSMCGDIYFATNQFGLCLDCEFRD